MGMPVAYFGFAAYFVLLCLALMRATTAPSTWRPLVVLGTVMAGFGALTSLYLQYTSLFVIKAFCPFCMASAITMIATLVTYVLLLQSLPSTATDGAESGGGRTDTVMTEGLAVAVVTILSVQTAMLKKSTGAVELPTDRLNVELIPATNRKQYGIDSAPVTVVEFADLCCPSCQINSPKLKALANQYPGRMRIIYRHFPLPMHVQGDTAAAMGEYAQTKGKFWEFAMALMSLQAEPKEVEQLLAAAKAADLDTKDMIKHLEDDNDPIYKAIQNDKDAANKLGVNSTPTFIVSIAGVKPQVAKAQAVFELLDSPPYKKLLENKS
jgi:protein-disulfide isomerase